MVEKMEKGVSNSFWGVANRTIVNENKPTICINNTISRMQIAMESTDTKEVSTMDSEKLKQEIPTQCLFFNTFFQWHTLNEFWN